MPTARVLAQRFGAELQTISVAGADDDVDQLRAHASTALGVALADRRALVVTGVDAAQTIAQRAEELGACAVCMATHGRGRLHGAVVGSVARSMFQRSSEAVVALGPLADNPGWSPRPRSWPEPLSVERMVVCVDGSDTSEEVLPVSAAWARELGMSMSILTIVDDQAPLDRPAHHSTYGSSGDADTYIAELVQRWRGTIPDVDGVVVRDPIGLASGFRAHLRERPAGLVALTTHARSGMQRVLLGAAAANIVQASVAPCLVVPLRS